MSLTFENITLGQRVLFGYGRAARNLAAEADRLGARRVMVIAAPAESAIADRVTADLPVVLRHTDVRPHVPVEQAEAARAAASACDADLVVCVGGGSTTGLAKAVALTTRLPIVAVPTTYAGSEATNVWGLTEAARKTTGVDDAVLPVAVVYDSELTLSLPVGLSVASGLNAIAHCVDSMWAPRTNPVNQAFAMEGLRAVADGLRRIVRDPDDIDGRDATLYGCYLSGVAFASAGSGLHHKICHVLGGAYDLPHAQTHATVLPYVLQLNAPGAPDAAHRIAAALGSSTPVSGLNALRETLDAPRALADHGMRREDIPEAAGLILPYVPQDNPVPVGTEELTDLLTRAWAGEPPRDSEAVRDA
ncbi:MULTISPECIES: maleylacetate reductase [Streptomyces]|uniref:Maleylacetate reductase n=1 Tax=Streptomyces caniscabiei TaxID=2746961 RepID=A0ABU4MWW5_9ACTN|nr:MULTISPECIES: maleylacetate reductase [Streptomyces]MBE4741274.1 maleylacetate reductase [Streptomyces caniscabiei]MBE4760925.1 maleylacetate reductase [Streptomyces caniscabiei]MBE4774918.1 maleylacetate reductase [Streptomyces caniscabiei]MBE4789676.1 maleylacetate reductase [Streptomyces caniscabiei]MBE4798859.1 maleylacetate reductase [Streptomyces caniscabiei]